MSSCLRLARPISDRGEREVSDLRVAPCGFSPCRIGTQGRGPGLEPRRKSIPIFLEFLPERLLRYTSRPNQTSNTSRGVRDGGPVIHTLPRRSATELRRSQCEKPHYVDQALLLIGRVASRETVLNEFGNENPFWKNREQEPLCRSGHTSSYPAICSIPCISSLPSPPSCRSSRRI